MATFEIGSREKHKTVSTQKFPYKRLEPSVRKFIKVLQIDLDRLRLHRANIEKYHAFQQWQLMTKEQINASRMVKQLKASTRQLEQTRTQLVPEDYPKFDQSIEDIQQETISAIMDFLDLQTGHNNKDVETSVQSSSTGLSRYTSGSEEVFTDQDLSIGLPVSQPSVNSQTQPHKQFRSLDSSQSETEDLSSVRHRSTSEGVSQQQQTVLDRGSSVHAEESWQDLKGSLVELNTLIHDFSTVVHAQQETVDQIQDNIDHAQLNVEQGTLSLGTAAKLKGAIFPVAGALLGGAIGGPVGLVAGIKLGGLAAVTGGLAGFTGGHLLKKRQNLATDSELQQLSSRNVTTLPYSVSPITRPVPGSPSARSSYSDPGS